jgi:hypothetical protein
MAVSGPELASLAPEFADRVRAATREARYVGTAVLNFFRRPTGRAGRWSRRRLQQGLITGHGIHDAFRDAELCAAALDEAFSGAGASEAAMGRYQATRDQQVLPTYELTTQLATLEPAPPELPSLADPHMRQLLPGCCPWERPSVATSSPTVL